MKLNVRCPAKVNLFLSVGPPDQSGYHPIRTVFQAIGIFENITLELADQDSFCCSSPKVPEQNTVTKAWRLAKEYTDFPMLRVTLKKAGWTQGGLGLGSSNAAGMLRGLVELSRGRFTTAEAAEVARAVGADVPFFLTGGTAQGENYGDRIRPLPDLETTSVVVAKPPFGVETPAAYRRLDDLPRQLLAFPADPFKTLNDFEDVMPQESRNLIGELIKLGARSANLCGSGSAVFGLFACPQAALEAERCLLAQKNFKVACCQTLTRQESLWMS